MVNSATALLIFSRTPAAESACKHISGDDRYDKKLLQALYTHTHSVARATGLPLRVCGEVDQGAGSFAEKITRAVEAVFAAGFERVIVIGGDCPGLNKHHILAAEQQLNKGARFVAGPDCRGGVYLLALHRSVYRRQAFLRFSWQTPHLYNHLCDYAAAASYELLRLSVPLRDVHTSGDAVLAAKGSVFLHWHRLVTALSAQPAIPSFGDTRYDGPGRARLCSLRAPPATRLPAMQ